MSVTVRFAPSPTGLLHVGNARVALLNWLLARAHGGRFVLRLDDTDEERSEDRFAVLIEEDLKWMGLDWDEKARQSERLDRYHAVTEKLKAEGLLYPCYETPDELELKRKLQRARGKPPVYDRAALKLNGEDKAKLEAEGRHPHWRFKLAHEEVIWDDLSRGPCHYHGEHVSDPVLIRADGTYLYTLPSVVDDVDLGITHVLRGEDHVTNTAVQIQLYRALGAEPPTFAHLPLITGAEGEELSKRIGGPLSLEALRGEGIEPMALASLLAKLGSSEAIEARETMADLVAEFDIAHFSRNSPRFDPRELMHLNARVLHFMPYTIAAERLHAMGMEGVDEAMWDAVKPNLEKLEDVRHWWSVCRAPVTPDIAEADREMCAAAADLLPPEPWTAETWKTFAEAVKQATGRKGGGLFKPLRKALTGEGQGPELAALLPLIGWARAQKRLNGEVA